MSTANSLPNVTVIGAGSWGTALAILASRQCPTLLWARNPETVNDIKNNRTNSQYLGDIQIPSNLDATNNLQEALLHAESAENGLIILGVPVRALQSTCIKLSDMLKNSNASNLSVLWTCKGLQENSGLLPHQVAEQALSELQSKGMGLGVLSGPSFAHEVARGLPVALTVATRNNETVQRTIQALHGEAARIYSSTDIAGVEIGGALKNVIAVACGISDGLQLGDNARAALITRGLAEIQRLGTALGGQPSTFFGLTGLGDLVLTTTGSLSRNRQVGLAIGEGQSLTNILASGITAEGVRCVQAVLQIAAQHELELPICQAVYNVLFNNLTPSKAVHQLLTREAKPEHF